MPGARSIAGFQEETVMHKLLIFCLALAAMLAACTHYMYGVPQETWDRMSEAERIEAIRAYEVEQQARRQAAEERAQRRALERERELERARQAALERERIEAIHRGEGAYGELIRVRLQGGRMKIGGQHHRYEPLTFTIATGETRTIPVVDNRGREVDLVVTYAGGALAVEGIRFPYDRSWGRGRLYPDTSTAGPLELRGVDVHIDVHDRSARFEREVPRLVIIREEPPPVVVVRETPPPPVVVVREPHTPPPPPVVARREPHPPRPPRGVGRDQEGTTPPAPDLKQEPPRSAQPARPPAPAVAGQAPRLVEVALLAGEMKVRGRNLKLERTTLRIAEGESRELTVSAGGDKATISVQYHNGELIFDGNPGRGRDAVRFPSTGEWQRGKEYRFALKGRTHLEKVEVRVTGVAGK
jgi:hypothetical protein